MANGIYYIKIQYLHVLMENLMNDGDWTESTQQTMEEIMQIQTTKYRQLVDIHRILVNHNPIRNLLVIFFCLHRDHGNQNIEMLSWL